MLDIAFTQDVQKLLALILTGKPIPDYGYTSFRTKWGDEIILPYILELLETQDATTTYNATTFLLTEYHSDHADAIIESVVDYLNPDAVLACFINSQCRGRILNNPDLLKPPFKKLGVKAVDPLLTYYKHLLGLDYNTRSWGGLEKTHNLIIELLQPFLKLRPDILPALIPENLYSFTETLINLCTAANYQPILAPIITLLETKQHIGDETHRAALIGLYKLGAVNDALRLLLQTTQSRVTEPVVEFLVINVPDLSTLTNLIDAEHPSFTATLFEYLPKRSDGQELPTLKRILNATPESDPLYASAATDHIRTRSIAALAQRGIFDYTARANQLLLDCSGYDTPAFQKLLIDTLSLTPDFAGAPYIANAIILSASLSHRLNYSNEPFAKRVLCTYLEPYPDMRNLVLTKVAEHADELHKTAGKEAVEPILKLLMYCPSQVCIPALSNIAKDWSRRGLIGKLLTACETAFD